MDVDVKHAASAKVVYPTTAEAHASPAASDLLAPLSRAEWLDAAAILIAVVGLAIAVAVAWAEARARRRDARRRAERASEVIAAYLDRLAETGQVVRPLIERSRSRDETRAPRDGFARVLSDVADVLNRLQIAIPPEIDLHVKLAEYFVELRLAQSIFAGDNEAAMLDSIDRLNRLAGEVGTALRDVAARV